MEKVKAFFTSVDKLYHIIAGLIIGALFTIVLPMEVPIIPVMFAAFIKEFIDDWRYGKFDWYDFIATMLGGVVIQIMVVISLLLIC